MNRQLDVTSDRKVDLVDRRSLLGVAALACLATMASRGKADAEKLQTPKEATEDKDDAWTPLFNTRDLTDWKVTPFGGEGEVSVEQGEIVLQRGSSMTGITYTGEGFPKTNYEIRCEAQRVDGNDFFFGLTFPVNDSFCSWICGGWGGTVVGLSSIDSEDASENATRRSRMFRKATWYRLRLRVTDTHIQAFIDEELVIDQPLEEHTLSTRPEVALNKPLGICTWETSSRLRQLAYRRLENAREE